MYNKNENSIKKIKFNNHTILVIFELLENWCTYTLKNVKKKNMETNLITEYLIYSTIISLIQCT